MISNFLYGPSFVTPFVDLSNAYGYGDGYFQGRSGITGRPQMRGQLLSDTVTIETQKQKDKRTINKVLNLAILAGCSFVGYKFLKGPITKLWQGLKGLFKSKVPTP